MATQLLYELGGLARLERVEVVDLNPTSLVWLICSVATTYPPSLCQNILNPSTKIQCDECKGDISKTTKLTTQESDYCCSCFCNLKPIPKHYHVINKLDFPLFDVEWTAQQELLMFEGLQKHGFGNWNDIADHISTNKNPEEVEEHYQKFYLSTPNFIPVKEPICQRGNKGIVVQKVNLSPQKRQIRSPVRNVVPSNSHLNRERGSLTVHQSPQNKQGSNPAQIVGYMPKRGDFEVEYDNDAELLLAEMEFNDEDTEQEKAMKFRVMDIYNEKLTERIKRKKFVIERRLLDLREQVRLDKARTKQEKQIYNMMKVFARFTTAQEHEKLVQGLIREKQLRQKIQELKDLKKKGYRNLDEAEEQLDNKKRKEDKLRKREVEYLGDKSKMRRMRKEHSGEKEKRPAFEDRMEEALFNRLGLSYRHYVIIKETLTREALNFAKVNRDYARSMFNIDWSLVEPIYDHLVDSGVITEDQNYEF